jgi:CMP-N-acetylneuraminic acid synthetase
MEVPPKKVLAVIPARGGSKGITQKNLIKIGDSTLVQRAVSSCVSAKRVTQTYVSSDNYDILDHAKQYGANILLRPQLLASDTASSESVLFHTLDYAEQTNGYEFDIILLIQATSPFAVAEDIDDVVDLLETYDSVFTGYRTHEFVWELGEFGAVGINHDPRRRLRRQEIRAHYFIENGAAYGMRCEGFKSTKQRFFGSVGIVEMPKLRSIEIDDHADVDLAELINRHPSIQNPK